MQITPNFNLIKEPVLRGHISAIAAILIPLAMFTIIMLLVYLNREEMKRVEITVIVSMATATSICLAAILSLASWSTIETVKQSHEQYRQTSIQNGTIKSIINQNTTDQKPVYVVNVGTKQGSIKLRTNLQNEAKTMKQVIPKLHINNHLQFQLEGFYSQHKMHQVRFKKLNIVSTANPSQSKKAIKIEQLFNLKD